jgi:hypothetical protein
VARLAFYTFAILKQPWGHPEVQGFIDAVPGVFGELAGAEGFITRAERPDLKQSYFGQHYGAFGGFAVPRFYTHGTSLKDLRLAVTLSLWTDIAAVRRYSYGGPHKEALAQRTRWFVKPQYPSFAMWWVDDDDVPTWQEAADRLEHLHDHGPTPQVFKFSTAFAPDGNRIAP